MHLSDEVAITRWVWHPLAIEHELLEVIFIFVTIAHQEPISDSNLFELAHSLNFKGATIDGVSKSYKLLAEYIVAVSLEARVRLNGDLNLQVAMLALV
jgi:hypothetical protein